MGVEMAFRDVEQQKGDGIREKYEEGWTDFGKSKKKEFFLEKIDRLRRPNWRFFSTHFRIDRKAAKITTQKL